MNSSRSTWIPQWISSVRAVMILLISLATIFPLGIILYQGLQHRTQAFIDSRALSERLTAEVAFDQQLLLSSAKQLMSTFSYIPAIRRRDTVATNALLVDLLRENPQITNFLIADEKGNAWASGLPMKGPINVADRRYFRNVIATGRFSSGEFYIGRIRNKPTILFGYPLKDGSGRVTDVAVVSLSTDQYERHFQLKGLATDASLALLDHNGTVIFARPSSVSIGQPDREDLFRRMTNGLDEGSFEAAGETGVHRVFAYRKLRLPGETQPYMYVRAGISVSSILNRAQKDFLFGMGSIAAVAILILLLSVLLSKRFVLDKVAALREATERISRGDLSARVPGIVSGGELGELGSSFDNMARRLQEAETERKEAVKELRESETRYRSIFDSSADGIVIIDPDTATPVEFNQQACTQLGYTREEFSRLRISDIDLLEGTEEVNARIRKVLNTGYDEFETAHRTKHGERRNIHVKAQYILVGGKPVYHCIWRDITDSKRAEEEKTRLEGQLHQAMKMEAIGRLAGGVAHDFNNLLTVITGYSELLLQRFGKDSPMHGEVEEIKRAGDRAASLTQQLLAFSRKQIIEPKVVRLDLLVADMQSMMTRLIGENIVLQATTGESLGSVKIDPGQFQQILMNLAVNARDAMPEGGKIVIETANVDLDEGYCATHRYVTPGRFVMLSVSDTGKGMSKEVKAQIFEPFFTTKEKGKGTGLGLAMTYGAVKQAGGSIEVYSEVGIGTTFKIYLPRVEEEASQSVKDDRPQDMRGGSETVLLVEDDDTVRNLCVQILERLGYKVLQARNGAEAIALAQEYGDRIDLLLTDVVMPGMNGAELARQLVLHHPERKVLFTSGYTDDAIVRHGILKEGVSFIGKPYTPSAMAKKVRGVLDR